MTKRRSIVLVSEPLGPYEARLFQETAGRFARCVQLALDLINERGITDIGRLLGLLKDRATTLTGLPQRLVPSAASYALTLSKMGARTVRSCEGLRLLPGAYKWYQNGFVASIVIPCARDVRLTFIQKSWLRSARWVPRPRGRLTLKLSEIEGKQVVKASFLVKEATQRGSSAPQLHLPL